MKLSKDKIAKISLSILFLIFILMVAAMIILGSEWENRANKEEIVAMSDFKTIKTIVMHTPDKAKVTIIEDTSTGIQYMYLWGGADHGGPAICRYWRQDE